VSAIIAYFILTKRKRGSRAKKPRYTISLHSWASRNDEKCPYLLDKKVTDLWFEIIKDYESEKDVVFDHWTTCRPMENWDDPNKPSDMLHIYTHDYDKSKNADGTRSPVYYSGDYSEESIREFINNFIYSDRKKYRIELIACAGWESTIKDIGNNPDKVNFDKYSYPKDVQVFILWNKILKDYTNESEKDVEFDNIPLCTVVNRGDKWAKSPVLNLRAVNLRLPEALWNDRIIREYSGEYDEQSMRDFIDEIIAM
jgi:hypothetical protein